MKIEMTQQNYASANGFKLVGAGVHEVDDQRGRYLLKTFPDWFRPVEGKSEASQNTPDDAQPTKPLSRMNKDELTALADDLGIAIDGEVTNDELREVIKLHQQDMTESDEDAAEGDAV